MSNLGALEQWKGTAESLSHQLSQIGRDLKLPLTLPTVRTIRLWRAKKVLSQPPGQDFGYRQILECISTAVLLTRGWTLAAIGTLLPALSDTTLWANILTEAAGQPAQWILSPEGAPLAQGRPIAKQHADAAEEAVVLLAQGTLRQYDRVLTNEIVRQDDALPPELQSAMCRFGRLYIEHGGTVANSRW